MNKSKIKTILIETAGIACILLFVYAAASKFLDFNTFHNQLGQSPLLGAYADMIVWLVPLSEIAIAILLAIPRWKIFGFYAFFALMLMFTAYIIIILNFTSHTPCSCGGVLEDMGWTEHLVFNILFVLLSGVALLWLSDNRYKTLLGLVTVAFISTISVALIYLGSEKEMKQNNAFIRKYMPHPIEKIGEYILPSNSFYLAGIDDDHVYLGNYNAPLYIKKLSTMLTNEKNFRVSIDSLHLPYRRVRITVKPPHFYVGDGTVPILFHGHTSDWKATVFSHRDAYFSSFVVADSLQTGITTTSTENRCKALGLLSKRSDSIFVEIKDDLLSPSLNQGSFESDGILLWNDQQQQFVYTYFYLNRYKIMDKNLTFLHSLKTIDTLSKPVLDIAHYAKEDYYKLGGRSIMVNRQSTTYGDYLYINSDRLGRYEGEEVLKMASIVDVYGLADHSYAFSFYLYHQPKQKINDFKVYKNVLVALVDDQLWIYRLKPAYFNADL